MSLLISKNHEQYQANLVLKQFSGASGLYFSSNLITLYIVFLAIIELLMFFSETFNKSKDTIIEEIKNNNNRWGYS